MWGTASAAIPPIAIAQFVCEFAGSCGACGVLGGVDGCAGNGELGPGVGGYWERSVTEFKISAWCGGGGRG